jgi:hypothetical protein
MLTDLMSGHSSPSTEPISASGLGGLLHGQEATRSISLPQALNAVRRGELDRPSDSTMAELMPPTMPTRPAPSPPPCSYQDGGDRRKDR